MNRLQFDLYYNPVQTHQNKTFVFDFFRFLELEVHFLISSLTGGDDVLISADNCRIIVETKKVRQEKLISK
jgi:hypothetical protein